MSDDDSANDVSDLDQAIEALQQHDAEEVADALDSKAHSVYQTIHDDGRQNGKNEIKRKKEDAEQRAEELESKLQAKQEEVEQLREEQPDTDQLYEQWKEQELQPVKEELGSLKNRVKESSRKEAQRSVRKHVADEVGDEELADAFLAKHRDRIKVNGQGEVDFLRPNGQPYATRSDQDPAELFAQDVVEQIPERYRTQNEQGGPRSTEKTATNGHSQGDGLTRKDLANDPMKMAEFRKQYDSEEEFSEALDSLPNE